jgi:hypothetical protein
VVSDDQTLDDFVYVILGSTKIVLKSFLALKKPFPLFLTLFHPNSKGHWSKIAVYKWQTIRFIHYKIQNSTFFGRLWFKNQKEMIKNGIFCFYFNITAKQKSFLIIFETIEKKHALLPGNHCHKEKLHFR